MHRCELSLLCAMLASPVGNDRPNRRNLLIARVGESPILCSTSCRCAVRAAAALIVVRTSRRRNHSMLRRSFVFGALLAITLAAANGCQSCSSCHDYDPPVANCHCGGCSQCGCNSGCSSCGCNSGYSSCGCNGGCSSCNGGTAMAADRIDRRHSGPRPSRNADKATASSNRAARASSSPLLKT